MDSPDLAPDAPWDLLARYLAGEATPTEQAELRTWASQRPEHQAVLTEATQAWTQAGPLATAAPFGLADVDQAWQRFETQVWGVPPSAPPPSSPPPVPPTTPPVGWVVGWGKAAALLVVGASSGWLLRTAMPPAAAPPSSPAPVATASAPPAAVSAAAVPAAIDLIFEDEPVRAVAQRLESAFPGTRIEVAEAELAQQRFTGTFRAARPEAVLRVVSVATGAELTRRPPDSTWVLLRPASR